MRTELKQDNAPLLHRIEESIHSGRIAHALIIEAPADVDKPAFAKEMAKAILCETHLGENCGACAICDKIDHGNHEDLLEIAALAGKQTIGIEQIRQMQAQVAVKPGGPRYIVLIEESERMTEAAQNCLLKTLEEPPGDCVLMLLTENTEHLLPTIRSRCVSYRFEGDGMAAEAQLQEMAEALTQQLLGGAPFYRMKQTLGSGRLDRDRAVQIIDCMEQRCRTLALSRDDNGVPGPVREIARCVRQLEHARRQIAQGLTPGYVMKRLLLAGEEG